MSRLLRELIRKPSSSNRFITTFTQQNPSNLSSPLLFNQSILSQTKFDHGNGFSLNPNTNQGLTEIGAQFNKLQGLTEIGAQFNKLQIYPSFSFGYFIDPIPASGFGPIRPEMEHSGMMWADSVKKKRKKKMNKHKYKKLRKRLRRKTKT